jgi:glucokinase
VLGIDLGGTKIAFAVSDLSGRFLQVFRRASGLSGNPDQDLAAIASDAEEILTRAGVGRKDLVAIGLSSPGPIDPASRRILSPPNLLGWTDVPAPAVLENCLGCPCFIENDANAAALAEWRFGAAKGTRDAVYLTMSTGVGAGLVLGGRLHRGVAWCAGEVGHAPVQWNGLPCACGLRGCLEAYVGGRAWTEHLRAVAAPEGRVALLAGGREHVQPEHVVAAAHEGDAFALAQLERFNGYLARSLVQITCTVAPEVIVLGTIPTAVGEALCFEPIRRAVRERVWGPLAEAVRIVPAALGERLPYYAGLSAALAGIEGSGESI